VGTGFSVGQTKSWSGMTIRRKVVPIQSGGRWRMPYSCRVFNTVDAVDLAAWERVRSECGASVFMDTRFIAAVETSMKESCRFWYVIVYDDGGRPVAIAGLSTMTIDLTDFADPRLASIIKRGPKMLSRFRKLKVLFCSLPGTPGDKSIALAAADASSHILSVLDGVMCDLAEKTGMDAIIYKEFEQGDLEWMDPLLQRGYQRIAIPPMHLLRPSFENFAQYCAALRTRYRQQINRSTRKLKNTGIEQTVLTDPDEILKAYTPEAHAMYCEMVAKSDVKLEVFPIEYYRQLTTRLKGQVELIAFFKDSRIIAFGWCLHDQSTYHMMYAGLDYRLNHQFDLYFNLMYAGFDRALRKRPVKIHVGQTATVFKARMGCYSEPRYIFAKGFGPIMSRVFRYGGRFLVIKKPSNPPSDIFKRGDGENLK
jgi:predicted N-acyltransferase